MLPTKSNCVWTWLELAEMDSFVSYLLLLFLCYMVQFLCCLFFSFSIMIWFHDSSMLQTTPVLFSGTSSCRDDSTSLRTGSVSIATSSAGKRWYCRTSMHSYWQYWVCVCVSNGVHLFVCLKLTVRLKDICSMTKEKTARLIPNAIQVCTDTEKVRDTQDFQCVHVSVYWWCGCW